MERASLKGWTKEHRDGAPTIMYGRQARKRHAWAQLCPGPFTSGRKTPGHVPDDLCLNE